MSARSSSLVALLVIASGCTVVERPADPCTPNPCTAQDRNVCVVLGDEATCVCNDGFVARPSGACEPISDLNCPTHGGDSAEPDDCHARARPFEPGSPLRQQTIDPIGDYDFFTFSGKANEVIVANVKPTSGALAPRIDLFDPAGTLVWIAEGAGEVTLATKLYFTGQYALRVMHSPVDPSVAVGAYSISLQSLGQEDHGDGPDEATSLSVDLPTAPSTHNGRFEFADDQDWFRFSGDKDALYRLQFDSSRNAPILSLWRSSNMDAPHWTVQQTSIDFDVPADGTYFLAISPPDASTGSYAFTFTTTSP